MLFRTHLIPPLVQVSYLRPKNLSVRIIDYAN